MKMSSIYDHYTDSIHVFDGLYSSSSSSLGSGLDGMGMSIISTNGITSSSLGGMYVIDTIDMLPTAFNSFHVVHIARAFNASSAACCTAAGAI